MNEFKIKIDKSLSDKWELNIAPETDSDDDEQPASELKSISWIIIKNSDLAKDGNWVEFNNKVKKGEHLYLWVGLKNKLQYSEEAGEGVLTVDKTEFEIVSDLPKKFQKKTLDVWYGLKEISRKQYEELRPIVMNIEGGLGKLYLLTELLKIHSNLQIGKVPAFEPIAFSFVLDREQDLDIEEENVEDEFDEEGEPSHRGSITLNTSSLWHLDADLNNKYSSRYHKESYCSSLDSLPDAIKRYNLEGIRFREKFKPTPISRVLIRDVSLGREKWGDYEELINKNLGDELELITKPSNIQYVKCMPDNGVPFGKVIIEGDWHLRKKYISEAMQEQNELKKTIGRLETEKERLILEKNKLEAELYEEKHNHEQNKNKIQTLENTITGLEEQLENIGATTDELRNNVNAVDHWTGNWTINPDYKKVQEELEKEETITMFRKAFLDRTRSFLHNCVSDWNTLYQRLEEL